MLGTTEIYTRVSIQHLKRIHEACHPAARIEPAKRRAAASSAMTGAAASESELLDALAAEETQEREEGAAP
jgi:hypothetical protein